VENSSSQTTEAEQKASDDNEIAEASPEIRQDHHIGILHLDLKCSG